MKHQFLLLLSLAFPTFILAQAICGSVKNKKGEFLAGASIAIKNSYDGSTTDSLGHFCLVISQKGRYQFIVSAIGYKTIEETKDIGDSNLAFSFILKDDITEMNAVVITAGSFEASDKKRGVVLTSTDVLTTSTNADITNAIKTLPGTQQIGEAEGLFVRGGTAFETKTYIDGALVNNFFFSGAPDIPQRSRYNPMLFKGSVFSEGGYSALYGQALSSALILETTDFPETSSAMIGIHTSGASGGYTRLSKNEKISWGVNYGYMNPALIFKIIEQKQEYFKTPVYHNADINLRIRISKKGTLKYLGYLGINKLGFRSTNIDSVNLKDAIVLNNINTYHNISYNERLTSSWNLNAAFSFTYNRDTIQREIQNNQHQRIDSGELSKGNFGYRYTGNYVNTKLIFEHKLSVVNAIRFGNENMINSEQLIYKELNKEGRSHKISENLVAFFAESDFYFTNKLAVKFGARYERSGVLKKGAISPRFSAAQKIGDYSQVSFAYGMFYQLPETKYLMQAARLQFSKATHFILQYQRIKNRRTFRSELFYKHYSELITIGTTNNTEVPSNDGKGYAKGLEFFWRDRKTLNGFDYWVSYSFIDTKRKYLNYPGSLHPSFAATHSISVVVKKLFPVIKTQINANYNFASGRPYYNIQPQGPGGSATILDHGKTISYNNLGLSFNYLPNITSNSASKYTVLVFSVSNILGNKQVYGYRYSMDNLNKSAVVPPAKTYIFLGIYLSFGVDKTADIINSL